MTVTVFLILSPPSPPPLPPLLSHFTLPSLSVTVPLSLLSSHVFPMPCFWNQIMKLLLLASFIFYFVCVLTHECVRVSIACFNIMTVIALDSALLGLFHACVSYSYRMQLCFFLKRCSNKIEIATHAIRCFLHKSSCYILTTFWSMQVLYGSV